MDNIKMFEKEEKVLKTLMQTIRTHNQLCRENICDRKMYHTSNEKCE